MSISYKTKYEQVSDDPLYGHKLVFTISSEYLPEGTWDRRMHYEDMQQQRAHLKHQVETCLEQNDIEGSVHISGRRDGICFIVWFSSKADVVQFKLIFDASNL